MPAKPYISTTCPTSRLRRVLGVAAVAWLALPAAGQVIYEDLKLTADDAAAFDQFGISVAISGTVAIVGASTDDDDGWRSGSAYLFDTTTGQQLFKLTASDATEYEWFGYSVGISGATAIVGIRWDGELVNPPFGSAYLFDTTTGQQLFELTAPNPVPDDRFGRSVAISGTTAIVGAYPNNHTGSNSGSAYLFDTTTGQQLHKLTADDAATGDFFGTAVAISGTIAIVGAHGDDDGGTGSGAAYIFDTTTGQQLHKLTASDAATFDIFGSAVAISGTTAVVGATGDDDAGVSSGSAYVFDTTTGQQLFKLTASDAAEGDRFGGSVAISGTTAVVGATGDDDAGNASGSTYLFDTTAGQQLFKFAASDAEEGDLFGESVGISGGAAIVGVSQDDGVAATTGSAYVFRVPCNAADLAAPRGVLDLADISAFITAFVTLDPVADLEPDGVFDLADIVTFLTAFNAGCP